MNLFKTLNFIFITWIGLSSCSPKVYLVDRQTVLEDEAAGDWPNFERALLEKSKAQGPTPFVKGKNSAQKERLYRVLNGEMVTPQSHAAAR